MKKVYVQYIYLTKVMQIFHDNNIEVESCIETNLMYDFL